MAVVLQDVVSANLVLVGVGLLNEPDELEQFRNEFAPDLVLTMGLVVNGVSGTTEPSRDLTLSRERIRLTLHASRSTIAVEYPDDAGLDKLADAVAHAEKFTDLGSRSPRAFGYNMELVLEQDSGEPAIQYIARGLFRSLLQETLDWNFAGGSGQLIFTDDAGRWTISVEPRFNDAASSRVFLSVNLHKDEPRLPDEDEIRTTLSQVKERALTFAGGLDKRGE